MTRIAGSGQEVKVLPHGYTRLTAQEGIADGRGFRRNESRGGRALRRD